MTDYKSLSTEEKARIVVRLYFNGFTEKQVTTKTGFSQRQQSRLLKNPAALDERNKLDAERKPEPKPTDAPVLTVAQLVNALSQFDGSLPVKLMINGFCIDLDGLPELEETEQDYLQEGEAEPKHEKAVVIWAEEWQLQEAFGYAPEMWREG